VQVLWHAAEKLFPFSISEVSFFSFVALDKRIILENCIGMQRVDLKENKMSTNVMGCTPSPN
jgi:hypothetical protein